MANVYEPEFPSGAGAGRALERAPERSVADVVKDIVGNIQEIVRTEVRLARAEIREKIAATARASAVLAVGAVIVFYALGFLLVSIYNLLSLAMPFWGAALVMFIGLGVISGIMIAVGISRLRKIKPMPERAVAVAKATVEDTSAAAKDAAQGAMNDAKGTVEAAKRTAADTVQTVKESMQTVKEDAKWSRNQNR
ncbi:MAG TPA: phage holin family protein [Bryobacteraceae bacterium]|nr:phage holin family protein [Bryobacteraceae bacterium]